MEAAVCNGILNPDGIIGGSSAHCAVVKSNGNHGLGFVDPGNIHSACRRGRCCDISHLAAAGYHGGRSTGGSSHCLIQVQIRGAVCGFYIQQQIGRPCRDLVGLILQLGPGLAGCGSRSHRIICGFAASVRVLQGQPQLLRRTACLHSSNTEAVAAAREKCLGIQCISRPLPGIGSAADVQGLAAGVIGFGINGQGGIPSGDPSILPCFKRTFEVAGLRRRHRR